MISSFLFLVNSSNAEFYAIEYVIIRSILAVLTAFVICLFLNPWVIRRLVAIHIRQQIREEGPKSHYKKAGTPTMGGILILIPLFVSTIIWTSFKNPLIWLLFFVTISFAIVGFIDDYIMQINNHSKGLKAKQKFILQLLLATVTSCLILVLTGFDTAILIPFFKNSPIKIGYASIIFSIVVIVGTSNAVNLTDGLDGLAISTITISKFFFMLIILVIGCSSISEPTEIRHVNNIMDLSIYCGAFIGSGLGFLWFNSPPAQVFMGDTGSLSIGASLGTLAILVKHEILLLLLGGIFVVETISVILQVCFFRISKGQRLFKMAPLHHHFELIGIPESKIVWRFFIISILLAFLSFLMFKFGYSVIY